MITGQAKTLILGVGSMGESILNGLIRSKIYPLVELGIISRKIETVRRIVSTYEINAFLAGTNAANAIRASDTIVLCCKPHDLDVVSEQIKASLPTTTVVISTLAGVTIAELQDRLSHTHVVRAIPNIASSLNVGVTVWTAAVGTSPDMLGRVRCLLESLGQSIEVEDEKYVELASPLSGAGPALVAFFVESLIDSSVYLGIPRALSVALITGTITGSMQLIAADSGTPADVRARVTSPGGLTAECIATLEQYGFRTAVLQSVLSGLRKTRELNSANKSTPVTGHAHEGRPDTNQQYGVATQ